MHPDHQEKHAAIDDSHHVDETNKSGVAHTTATLNAKMAKEMLGLKKEVKQLQEHLASKTKAMEELEQLYQTCLNDRDKVIAEQLNRQMELDAKEEHIRKLEQDARDNQNKIAALTYQLKKANQTMDPLAATGHFMSWVVDSASHVATELTSGTGSTASSHSHSPHVTHEPSPTNGTKSTGSGENNSPKLTKKQEEKLFIEKCRKKLAKNKQRITELEEKIAELTKRNEEEVNLVKSQKDQLLIDNEQSRNEVVSLTQEKEKMMLEIENMKEQLKQLTADNENQKQTNEDLKQRISQYLQSLEEIVQKNMELQVECENLKSTQLDREKQRKENERGELQKLRTEVLSLKLENSNLRRDIENQNGELLDLDQAQAEIHLKFNTSEEVARAEARELGLIDSFELTGDHNSSSTDGSSGSFSLKSSQDGGVVEPKLKEVNAELKLKVQRTFSLHESERVIEWFAVTGGTLYVTEDHICIDTISEKKKVQLLSLTEIRKSFILPCIEFKTANGESLVFKGFLHRREVMKLLLQLSLKIQHVIRFFNENAEMTVASVLLMKEG